MKSSVRERCFEVQIKLTDYATTLSVGRAGDYQASQVDGGGSIDPDDDFWPFPAYGGALNWVAHSNPAMDTLLDQAPGARRRAEK